MPCTPHEEMIPASTPEVELFVKSNPVASPKAAILMVHGLAEHQGRYDGVVDAFNSFGYSVYRFDNQGHGRSGGERGFLQDFNQFIDDADILVEKIIRETPGLPVFMLGHSMGGFITAAYGVKYPGKLAGQVLSGAAITVLPLFEAFKEIDFEADPRQKMPNDLSDLICRDKAVVDAYDNDPLVLKETCQKLLGEVFINGATWLTKAISDYRYPCLILHGDDDRIVTPEASRYMHETISSTDKELTLYDGFFHEILNDPGKENVIADIRRWLDRRIA